MLKYLQNEVFKSLSHREYRRYFFANIASSFGTWMQRLGLGWLVYRLTESSLWLGIITFSSWFSTFLLMPYAGAVLDTRGRRNIMRISQLVAMSQALLMGVLTLTGNINVYWILLLSTILGIANAFDMIGRNSLINDMFTDKKYLANAIALNSTGFNLSRMAGPALAGIIVAKYGEGVCFIINAICFLPFAYILTIMKLPGENPVNESELCAKKKISNREKIMEGVAYVRNHPILFPVLILLSIVSFMGMSIQMVLYPLIADLVLKGGAEALGWLTGAMGFGALLGALILASFRKVDRMHRLTCFSFGSLGIVSMLMAYSQNMSTALTCSAFFGAFTVLGWGGSNTLVQMTTSKDKISRVMSLTNMTFTGMSPLGSLFMGWFSAYTSLKCAIFLGGISCVLTGTYCYLKIYTQTPEIANN